MFATNTLGPFEEQILEIIARSTRVPTKNIHLSDNLFSDIGADSLDVVDLLYSVQDVFGIEIEGEFGDFFRSLGALPFSAYENEKGEVSKEWLKKWEGRVPDIRELLCKETVFEQDLFDMVSVDWIIRAIKQERDATIKG